MKERKKKGRKEERKKERRFSADASTLKHSIICDKNCIVKTQSIGWSVFIIHYCKPSLCE
jgi:hypothetical protein